VDGGVWCPVFGVANRDRRRGKPICKNEALFQRKINARLLKDLAKAAASERQFQKSGKDQRRRNPDLKWEDDVVTRAGGN